MRLFILQMLLSLKLSRIPSLDSVPYLKYMICCFLAAVVVITYFCDIVNVPVLVHDGRIVVTMSLPSKLFLVLNFTLKFHTIQQQKKEVYLWGLALSPCYGGLKATLKNVYVGTRIHVHMFGTYIRTCMNGCTYVLHTTF